MCTYNPRSSHTDHFEIQKRDSEESLLTFVHQFPSLDCPRIFFFKNQLLKEQDYHQSDKQFGSRFGPTICIQFVCKY